MAETLYDIHIASKLKHREVAERMAEYEHSPTPRNYTAIIKIYSRGTLSLPVMQALAFAYSVPLQRIIDASAASREEGIPEAKKRPRKTNSPCMT